MGIMELVQVKKFNKGKGDLMMAGRRTLREVKAEKAARKRKAIRRRRILVLVIEVLILLVLLGIGYVMTHYETIQQLEWFQTIFA